MRLIDAKFRYAERFFRNALSFLISVGFLLLSTNNIVYAQSFQTVGLYRTFERSLENNNPYTNKFNDVELTCTYTAPSGKTISFHGFFDGDGQGGGNLNTGNIWKIRFLPDEAGEWHYEWFWSDTTSGGEGTFLCDTVNAGKGILRPYKENPRWFAYNGTEPVWLKSYYESSAGSIAQPVEWLGENVYQPMLDRGYNHFMVNWLLPLCCFHEYYHDGPEQSTPELTLYTSGKASTTMRLDVWKMLEQQVEWLNDRDAGLHMFLGFDGSRNSGPAWTSLSENEKEFYVKYVVSRLAPYANIAGWSYVWEVPGDRETQELGWARLVKKYDVFDHLRTYQNEQPAINFFDLPEYNFAAVENHYLYSPDNRDLDFPFWRKAWSHHAACLAGYVPGKPVLMIEGNALWVRYWAAKCGATPDDLRQSAWGCVTAGASFLWCGHYGGGSLKADGPIGLPFYGDVNKYAASASQIDILADIMNNGLRFYTMEPADSLLSEQDTMAVWCLAEPGTQYLVFSLKGKPFKLRMGAGQYKNSQWVNAITGAGVLVPSFTTAENDIVSFTPPNNSTDWILVLRTEGEPRIREEAGIVSARTDESGTRVIINLDKGLVIPVNYSYGFSIRQAD